VQVEHAPRGDHDWDYKKDYIDDEENNRHPPGEPRTHLIIMSIQILKYERVQG